MIAAITSETDQTHATAHALVEQRAQLQEWLDRLDERGADMPDHVVQRVRTDYVHRLARVTEELSSHLGALRDQLAQLNEELTNAQSELTAANDSFAELQLRHMIGELTEEEWTRREPDLEAAVRDAERARDAISAEVKSLQDLVSSVELAEESSTGPSAPGADDGDDEAEIPEITGYTETEPEAATEVPAETADEEAETDSAVEEIFSGWPSEPSQNDDGEELPWLAAETEAAESPAQSDDSDFDELEFLRGVTEETSASPPAQADDEGSDDMAFLEELDRAIAASSASPAAEAPAEAAVPAAKGNLNCKECGATNDPRAWYCEICGMELTS
jgi:DNA repair exonuclease SbcCD ATPase subunit